MKNEERKMKNRSTHITIYKKMKRIYHSSFLSFHLNYSSFFIHHLKSVFILSFFVFHLMGCKDKEPITPKPDPTNNEYTVKVKIINGTTGKTLYTPSKMHLRIERKYGLGHIEDELLGSAYMDEDGGIEITYKHSTMGAKDGATAILYGGPWAVGFNLPTNQNIDTILYRSTWGNVTVHFDAIETANKLYYGYFTVKDSLILEHLCLVLVFILTKNL
jgi:hypothetical protein